MHHIDSLFGTNLFGCVYRTGDFTLTIVIGFVFALVCILGSFAAMGGHISVLMEPFEFIIIGGSSIGVFIIANPIAVIKDSGKAIGEAFKNKVPHKEDFLDLIGLLFLLMQEIKSKTKAEVEAHIDEPEASAIFSAFPKILADTELLNYMTDYLRLILLGSARSHEIEALMEDEINTIAKDKGKPYVSLTAMSDGLPALGIVAAVLGIIKAMGALDQPPEVLGHLIGSALVGTMAGIFMAYGMVGPLATAVKVVREKQVRPYVVVKQILIAHMNGATPHLSVEHGRKVVSLKDRPTIEQVEEQTMNVAVAAE